MFKTVKVKILSNFVLALILIISITASLFISISSQKEEGRYINLSGKLRMVSQKITKESLGVFRGTAATSDLKKTVNLYDKILNGLLVGDVSLGLKATENEEIVTQLEKVRQLWADFRSASQKIITNGPSGNESSLKFIEANNMELLKRMNDIVGMYEAEAQSKLSSIQKVALGFLLLAFFAFIFVTKQVTNSIVTPIRKIIDATNEITHGNFDIKIDINTDDELGDLANNLKQMAGELKKTNQDILNEKAAVEQKVKDAIGLSEEQSKYLNRNIDMLLEEVGKFASGDLDINIVPEKQDDELGKLVFALNGAIGNTRNMILKLHDAIEATASASTEISSSAEEMAAGAQEQSAQTTEVASAVEEMTSTIVETTNNNKSAATEANSSKKLAEAGGKVFQELAAGMDNIANIVIASSDIVDELGQNSEKIGEIIHVINDIADQTNLLALNAAIEAARAGEQGRGFAVVADEVRKLAERTTGATKEIENMIKTIQHETEKAVKTMHSGTEEVKKGKEKVAEAGDSLDQIIESSANVMQIVNQTSVASEEQNIAVEEISKNIVGINTVAQEAAIGVEQIATAANDLSRLTDGLQNIVSSFKINDARQNQFEQQNSAVGALENW